MNYFPFRVNVSLRLFAIVCTGYGTAWVLMQTPFWLLSFWLALLTFALLAELLRYIERSHREMRQLVTAIRQGDFTGHYSRASFRSGNMLGEAFGELVTTFRTVRQEKETHHQYLQAIVEQITIAIVCVDEHHRVQLVNQAAKELFRRPHLKHLHDLSTLDAELYTTLINIEAGEKRLLKVLLGQQLMHLSVQASALRLQGRYYRLLSLQDFIQELEENELQSWQKLIRVLTHEIMNSVIPIANLSTIVRQMLISDTKEKLALNEIDDEQLTDLHGSLTTMEERSRGLVSFVNAYRSLTQISPPRFSEVLVTSLLHQVHQLLKPTLIEQSVRWQQQVVPNDLTLKADPELVAQVLINLVNNALDALATTRDPLIRVRASVDEEGSQHIRVSDNGPGIPSEVAEQVFVPFFTTKSEGSGVGLSVSRQIMRLHRGSLTLQTQEGGGTTFTLTF